MWAPRGDIRAIGVETVELAGPGAPGVDQAYHLTQETRITLLLRVADYLRQFPSIDPFTQVHSHAELDPWTRPNDPGDALNIGDFRDDLRDLLDGCEPWRTVGSVATAQRASEEGETAASSASRVEVLLEAIESNAHEARWLFGTGLDER
jgi:broad specificity phosphatase PhoE